MKQEREGLLVSGLAAFAVLFWLGFVFHVSPRFPGSGFGLILGLSAATLMLVPLLYSVAKRVKPIHRWITSRVPMRTWLAIHIYAGLLATIVALLHTGHRFASPVGVALMSMTLLAMLSGFVGRYLLRYASGEAGEKRLWLAKLRAAYDDTAADLSRSGVRPTAGRRRSAGTFRRAIERLFIEAPAAAVSANEEAIVAKGAVLAEAMADVEYAVRTQEWFQRAFRLWLKAHGVLAAFLYASLALHVWLELRLGLRWLS